MDVTRSRNLVLLVVSCFLSLLVSGSSFAADLGPPEPQEPATEPVVSSLPFDQSSADIYASYRTDALEIVAAKDMLAAEKLLLEMPDVLLSKAVLAGDTLLVELVALGDPDRIPRTYPLTDTFSYTRRAAENFDVPMLKTLIRCGFMVPPGYNGLEWAANHGHLRIVQAYVDAGVDLNACDNNWNGTPLQQAIDFQRTEVVELLLKQGIDVNVGNKYGWTPLHAAARRGYIDYAQLLVDRGAKLNAKSAMMRAPIHEALILHQYEFARWLLKQGAELDAAAAAGLGDLDAVRKLFPDPLKFDLEMAGGPSPVFLAAEANQIEIVKHFISAGVDVNLRDKWDIPLLVCAAECGSTETVKYLIEQKADIQLRPKERLYARYFSPLHAAAHAGDLATIELLIDSGLPVDLLTPEGDSPLVVAAEKEQLAAIRLLVKRGAKVDGQAPGEYPLGNAIYQGQLELCQLLLELGANPNGTERDQDQHRRLTPLAAAVNMNRKEIFELLLKSGADSRGVSGRPVLNYVVGQKGDPEFIRKLIDLGADLSVKEQNGNTPLDSALFSDNTDHLRILLAAGAKTIPRFLDRAASSAGEHGDVDIMQALQPLGVQLVNKDAPHGTGLGQTALEAAIKSNRKDLVRHLMSQGVRIVVEKPSISHLPAVALAAEAGSKLVMLDLIHRGEDKLIELPPNPKRAPAQRVDPLVLALHAAAKNGRLDTLRAILRQREWKVDQISENIWNSLAADGKPESLKIVGQFIRRDDPALLTRLLSVAVENREVARSTLLLDLGADPNSTSKWMMPLLHVLAKKTGSEAERERILELANLLIDHGADPAALDAQHLNAAHYAVRHRHLELARLLIQRGTPLDVHLAAIAGELEFLKKSYEHEPNSLWKQPISLGSFVASYAIPNSETGQRSLTAKPPVSGVLCWAAAGGSEATLQWLLSLEAPELNINGTAALAAPLYAALEYEQNTAVRMLLAAGANPNGHAELPISLIQAARRENVEAIDLLVAAKVNLRQVDGYGRTGLHVATALNNIAVVQRLVKSGIPLDETFLGSTAMEFAFQRNSVEARAIGLHLLAAGANPQAGRGEVLYWEVLRGEPARVEAFLKAGLNPHVQTAQGSLPLHAAIDRYGEKKPHDPVAVEMIRLLLKYGADPEVPDKYPRTAIEYAQGRGLTELVEIMRQSISDQK